jgi:MFS transporter, DHA1 family, tetracycline resistance protein
MLKHSQRPVQGLLPVVLFTAFLVAFNLGAINPVLPVIVGQYGGTTFEVGLLYTVLSLANFLSSPVLGLLSDRYGRRPILLFSLAGVSAGYLLFSVGDALWVLFAGWFIVGLCDGTLGTVFAFAADTTELKNRTRTFSLISAAMSVGFVVGPLVGGQLARLSPVVPIFAVIAAVVLNAIWVYVALPETQTRQQSPLRPEQTMQAWNPVTPLQQTLRLPHLHWLLTSFFLMIATTIITLSHLPAAARDVFGWTPQQVAIPFAVFGVVDFIGQAVVLPALLPRLGEIRLAIIGSLLLVVTFALYGAFLITGSQPLLYLGIIINGIGQPFSESSLNGLMSRSVKPEIQGQLQGAVRAAFALGRIVGPLSASGLDRLLTPAAPYWLGSLQMLIAAIAVLLAIPKLKAADQYLKTQQV